MSDNRTLEERLLSMSIPVPECGCWLWTGQLMQHFDYGLLRYKNKKTSSHRASWMAFRGPIPEGMYVLHKCDTPQCINPDHLYLGTQLDNMRDRKLRNRFIPSTGDECHSTVISDDELDDILNSDIPHSELATKYGVNPSAIQAIRNGKRAHRKGVKGIIARKGYAGRPGELSPVALLTENQVIEILKDSRSQQTIATDYGVSRSCIQGIKNRRNWAHVKLP